MKLTNRKIIYMPWVKPTVNCAPKGNVGQNVASLVWTTVPVCEKSQWISIYIKEILNQIYINSIKFKLISDLKLEFMAICYYCMLINIWIGVLNLYIVVYFYNM